MAAVIFVASSLSLSGGDLSISRRALGRWSALAACAGPAVARAGFLEGSRGLRTGDSAAALSSTAVNVAQGIGIKPRTSGDAPAMDDLTAMLLRRTEENRAKNDAAVQRRTYLNSEGARIFPGDGLTVFENGVPFEITMDEYKALLESGRIKRGSRDILPAKP